MESLDFEGEVKAGHYGELSAAGRRRMQRRAVRGEMGLAVVNMVVAGGLTFGLIKWMEQAAYPIDETATFGPVEIALCGALAAYLWSLAYTVLSARLNLGIWTREGLRPGGSHLGPRHFRLDEAGVTLTGASGTTLLNWSAFLGWSEVASAYLLWTDPGAAVMVPKDALTDAALRERFLAIVQGRLAAMKD